MSDKERCTCERAARGRSFFTNKNKMPVCTLKVDRRYLGLTCFDDNSERLILEYLIIMQ